MELNQDSINYRLERINEAIDKYARAHPNHPIRRFNVDDSAVKLLPKNEVDRILGNNHKRIASYFVEEDAIYSSPEELSSGFKNFSRNMVKSMPGLFRGIRDLEGAFIEGILMHENIHRSIGMKRLQKKKGLVYKEGMYFISKEQGHTDRLEYLADPAYGVYVHGLALSFETNQGKKKLHLASPVEECLVATTAGYVLNTLPERYGSLPTGNKMVSLIAAAFLAGLDGDENTAAAWAHIINYPQREKLIADFLTNRIADKIGQPTQDERQERQAQALLAHLGGRCQDLEKVLSYLY